MTQEKLKLLNTISNTIYYVTDMKKKYNDHIAKFNTEGSVLFNSVDNTEVTNAVMEGLAVVNERLDREINRLQSEFDSL